MISKEARNLIQRLMDLDARRRYRACDLLREPWIKCGDLPLSIFETAGAVFRAHSVEVGRASAAAKPVNWRNKSKADHFNKSVATIHVQALAELKRLGYGSKAIEDSLRSGSGNVASGTIGGGVSHQNQIYKAY